MSKKQDFLRGEQSRDAHPEQKTKGSATDVGARGQAKGNVADHQLPGTPKVANDHNKGGNQAPTQTNQGQRTPESRHDRQTRAGGRGPGGDGTVGGGAG